MIIGSCVIHLTAEWCNSLKEKRMVVKSIVEKTKHKFNISIAEIDKQDIHKSIVIGFACVTNSVRHADEIIENVLNYIEKNTDAVIDDVEREIFWK